MGELQGTCILKPGECDIAFLAGIIVKAMTYADADPETALMHARKSAEAVCSSVFAREVGDPGNNRLDKLIELLAKNDKVPERVKIPLRVIQQYGNYGAHYQTDHKPVDRDYIDPCLGALQHVTNWYYLEYLGQPIPLAVAEANNAYEPQSPAPPRTEVVVSDPEGLASVMNLPDALRPYQWEGVSFLARNDAGLLADEMGLGKTVQTIVALRLLLQQVQSGRVLIITPNALAYNWQREVERWAPEFVVRRVIGTAEDRLATYRLPVQILIATYEQVRLDALDMDADLQFEVLVLDEAQRIKNRHSRAALACRLLRRKRAWMLTGTPLENSVDDLVSLFVFLAPGLVDCGMPPMEVHRRIRPHFLRRRKKDVLKDIPPILMQDMTLELYGAQETAYTDLWVNRQKQARQEGLPVSDMALFAIITKLKQLCNFEPESEESVKMDALDLLLEECSEADDKIIVFSQYVQTLKFISRRLGSFPHDIYTGEQTQEVKDAALTRFRTGLGPRVLLISLRAGGVGLNIQEASTVVLFDRWWNPAVENQAIQRAHRFGRDRPLHVVRFLIRDSIEERIAEVLRDKEMDFDRYIENADNAPVMLFTRQELRRVLGLTLVDTETQKA